MDGYLMGEMQSKSDADLLREYADHGTEPAFAELVTRYTNLVYSAAARQTDSPDIAAEITQRVFIGLARGVRALSPRLHANASLAGWLCRSARNISLNLRRDEFRRHSREKQAMEHLEPTSEPTLDWDHLRPVLDEAMSELSEPDYDALVMRFFNNHGGLWWRRRCARVNTKLFDVR
jgi:RNA polymerase sigma factor (sigma-70 family)